MKQEKLIIEGGVLNSLKANADRLGFKDAKSLLYFLVAVTEYSATRKVTVVGMDGKESSYMPTDKILAEYVVNE